MKFALWIVALILLVMLSVAAYPAASEAGFSTPGPSVRSPLGQQYYGSPQQYGQNEDSAYFYDRLSPYGDWLELNPYGYVWVPRHMGYRWRPYTDGRWVWKEVGWTWVANEEWGDIPFHYGRWGWDEEIGWFWVPGSVWGPSWVSWRSNDQYMGWAPLPPGFQFSIGMNFNSQALDIPFNFWVFIQGSHFQDNDINSYVLPFERNQTIVGYTSMRNNLYTRNNRVFNEGFGVDPVRQFTGRAVTTYALQNAPQPGRTRVVGQQVQVFQPAIKLNAAAKPKTVLNTTQARQILAPAKIFDPRNQQAIDLEAAAVQKRQIQEKTLLATTQAQERTVRRSSPGWRTTQAQEIKNMQVKRDAEALHVRDAAAKAKITQNYNAKITDLQKSHAVETQKITVRHQNDAVQVKRVVQTAPVKQNPPDKKKKID